MPDITIEIKERGGVSAPARSGSASPQRMAIPQQKVSNSTPEAGPFLQQTSTVAQAIPGASRISGAASTLVGTFTGLSAVAGPVSLSLAAVGAAAAATVIGLKKANDALLAEARRLSEVSPQLAGVQANIDVRAELSQLRRDQRRADKIGDNLAEVAELNAELREVFLEIKDAILTPLLEAVSNTLIPLLTGVLESTIAIIDALPGTDELVDRLRKGLRGERPIDDPFLKLVLGLNLADAAARMAAGHEKLPEAIVVGPPVDWDAAAKDAMAAFGGA